VSDKKRSSVDSETPQFFEPFDFGTNPFRSSSGDFDAIEASQRLNHRLDVLASLRALLSHKMQTAFTQAHADSAAGIIALTKNAVISSLLDGEYELASRLLDLLIELDDTAGSET
jgi:hypothetical protein